MAFRISAEGNSWWRKAAEREKLAVIGCWHYVAFVSLILPGVGELMCGRYEAGQKQKIAEAFHVGVELEDLYFGAGVECSPGSIQPVVYLNHRKQGDGEREIGLMRWGFKLPDRLLFNARAEGVADSNFWGAMFRERRCIVPASSFFEWRKTGTEPRPKYRLSVKGRGVFGMAGVWSPWMNPKTGQWEDTFSILTSDANGKMGEIHDRQPVILEPREYGEWLAESERPPVHLLRILGEEEMVVDPLVVEAKAKEKVAEPKEPGLFDGL